MKITKILIISVLVLALAAPLFLAGCGSDAGTETSGAAGTEANTVSTDSTPADSISADSTSADSTSADITSADSTSADTAATTDAPDVTAEPVSTDENTEEVPLDDSYVNPLEGLEMLSEDTSVANDDNGITLREFKFYRNHQFEKNGVTYHWFSFYNACVKGELRLSDPDVVNYARECYEFFEENDVEREIAHAKTLIDAAEKLAG